MARVYQDHDGSLQFRGGPIFVLLLIATFLLGVGLEAYLVVDVIHHAIAFAAGRKEAGSWGTGPWGV